MARLMSDLVDDLVNVIGFDITDAKALQWLNTRRGVMMVRARATEELIAVGTSTADQEEIVQPADIAELYDLTIGGSTYDPVPRRIIEGLRNSTASVSYPGLVYAPSADGSGNRTWQVYPSLAAGQAIVALAAIRPDPLVVTDPLDVPDEFVDGIVQGAAAIGYAYDPEQLAVAADFRAQFDAACGEYRAWVKRQGRGSGPRQIRVVGINA